MRAPAGFTLIEMLLGASIMSIVLIALIGAYLGQTAINMHARNLTLAMNDATRVMEAIRQQNIGAGCAATGPVAIPPNPFTSWDAWLADLTNGGGGKSIGPTPAHERVIVTCQDGSGETNPTAYCGSNQARGGGFTEGSNASPAPYDPIRITVAIGWREKNRVIGNSGAGQAEFQYSRLPGLHEWVAQVEELFTPAAYAGGPSPPPPASGPTWTMQDLDGNGVIDSQAMLTTLITCR